MKKPVSLIVAVFLAVVALMHILRLVYNVNVTVAGSEIPLWFSIFGAIVPVTLGVLLRIESLKN